MVNDNGLSIGWEPVGNVGKAALTVCLAEQVLVAERVDLLDPEKRADFAKRVCADHGGIDPKDLDQKLLQAAGELAGQLSKNGSKPEEAPPARPDPAALLATMPEAVRAEARAMLEAPDLMRRVVADIGLLGVAGEKKLAATVYLAGTSRLLPQPLAVIVQGPTSSGKSYVIKMAASLFPPEAVLTATTLTPQALYYMPAGSLVHRFIVTGERSRLENDDTAEATRSLREMISEGRLSKWAPIKEDGKLRTVQIQQDGPIAYIESTTLTKVFNEDANRCILLTTDEQPEQTRRILTKLAGTYSGSAACDVERIQERHHAAQRMLEPYAVIVPYAERLAEAIDHHRVEARRGFPQLVSMIQASALLHQRQRQVDGDGRLLAAPDDYQLARHLLAGPMGRQLGGGISEPAVRFPDRLREWFGVAVFTTPGAKAKETRSKSSVYGWIAELHDAGLIELVEAPRGNRAAQWRLIADAPDPEAAAVLPLVEKLIP
jgi:hypothetical protein